MKKFEDRSDGGMRITDNQVQIHLALPICCGRSRGCFPGGRTGALSTLAIRNRYHRAHVVLAVRTRVVYRARTQDAPFPAAPVSSIDVYECESFVKLAPCPVMML
jgi:hypothetical protein